MARRLSFFRLQPAFLLVAFSFLLAACGGVNLSETVSDETRDKKEGRIETQGRIFSDGGLELFGGKSRGSAEEGGGIGVNSFLWRASLDTISFMPVSSADPFGGVIITDWHATSGAANERFKLNVYILGRALRADGVRVSVFRQVLTTNGTWQDAAIADGTAARIEDSILTRARQLRNEAILQN